MVSTADAPRLNANSKSATLFGVYASTHKPAARIVGMACWAFRPLRLFMVMEKPSTPLPFSLWYVARLKLDSVSHLMSLMLSKYLAVGT